MLALLGYFYLMCLAVFLWTLVLLVIRIISKRTHKPFSILDGASYVLLFAACAVLIIRYDPEEKSVPALPAPARTNLALSIDSGQTEQTRATTAPYTPAASVPMSATPAPAVPTMQPAASTSAAPTAPPTQPPVATAVPTAPPTLPPATPIPTAQPTQPPAATAAPTVPPTQPPVATAVPTVPPTESPSSSTGTGSGGNADNFNTYNNPDQQQTEETYVLNTDSKKIHHPTCDYVAKIAPKNYATSSKSVISLEAQGYSKCKKCFK